jgi:hypothetical protein
MSLPVVLRPDATADLVAARDWYEQRRSGLGAKFVAAMDKMVARIEATPELYAVILKKVRRGKLRGFPTSSITECWPIASKYLPFFTAAGISEHGKGAFSHAVRHGFACPWRISSGTSSPAARGKRGCCSSYPRIFGRGPCRNGP